MAIDPNELPWIHIHSPNGAGDGEPTEDVTRRIPAAAIFPDVFGMMYRKLAGMIHCLCCNLEDCCATATQALGRANEAYDLAEAAYALALLGGGGPTGVESIPPKDPARLYVADGMTYQGLAAANANGNRVFYQQFSVARPGTIDELGITVNTASGASARIGIYSNLPTNKPGILLDFVTVSTGSTGKQSDNPLFVAAAGVYWLALMCQTTTSLLSFPNSGAYLKYGFNGTTPGTSFTHIYETGVWASGLPVTATATPTEGTGAQPIIWFGITED